MAASTVLLASHLSAGESVGRFVDVYGGETFEETEDSSFSAYVSAWSKGGGILSRGPATHVLILEGMRRLEAKLLCAGNVGVAGAHEFREVHGVPPFVTRLELMRAEADRHGWGGRCGGGPQLEVTIFGARGLSEDPAAELQCIVRTLSKDAKAYAKELAKAVAEHAGEFRFGDKAETLARDWGRAAARSPAFPMTIAEGVEWVRVNLAKGPDKASPKNKVKLVAAGGRARVFASNVKDDLPNLSRLVFPTRAKGTRLKVELRQRSLAKTNDVGSFDIVVDDIVDKNAPYSVGWLPLTRGTGQLQIRFYLLDPTAPNFDPANLSGRPAHVPAANDMPLQHAESPAAVEPPSPPQGEDRAAAQAQQEDNVVEASSPANDAPQEKPAALQTKPPPPPPKKKPPPPPPKTTAAAPPVESAAPPRPAISSDLASQLQAGASVLKKPEQPAAPPRPAISADLASQLQAGASVLKKADQAAAPAPRPAPAFSSDLASQLQRGASKLKKPADLPPPPPPQSETLFDALAAKVSSIRRDIDGDDDDEDDDFDD